jgi:hypothetical protein
MLRENSNPGCAGDCPEYNVKASPLEGVSYRGKNQRPASEGGPYSSKCYLEVWVVERMEAETVFLLVVGP